MKKGFLSSLSLLTAGLLLAGNSTFADVQIDGEFSDWSNSERINLPQDLPPALAAKGDKLYGKYVTSPEPGYMFAIETAGVEIGGNTTLWLNVDNSTSTGYLVWDTYSGAEFYVNINSGDPQPHLYTTSPYGEYAGSLDYMYNDNGTALEFFVPSSLLGDPASGIKVIADINDAAFIPTNYADGELTVSNSEQTLPVRTDYSKRVGIVYSQTSKEHFYDINLPIQKAYSQLFMSMQHHAMMAGIPFDMLNEDDLTDVSKLVNYDALIFPNFAYVPSDKLDAIHDALYYAVYDYGIGIITAGDWMTNGSDGNAISGDAYRNMKQLLGIGRVTGNGPFGIKLKAKDTTHPAMDTYKVDETIYEYAGNRWYSYFSPVSNGVDTQPVTVLASQVVKKDDVVQGVFDAVIASKTGGRNVHFSSLEFMGDTNLLWSALQWSVYGNEDPVALKMGRMNNLFVSRNDMDQSQEIDEVAANDGVLLTLLQQWKTSYNFVGSYYINVGNTPPDQQTDWAYSGPLYAQYVALGNEIGTHSYTHPYDTNLLTSDEVKFEFDDSMNIIAQNVNPTWQGQNIRGAAVPGAPESLDTASSIIQYLDYLTGGYSSVGAGYPGAFGYLTPEMSKVYFSPNMAFDFTLIEYGIPVWDAAGGTYVPQPLTAAEAEQYWQSEYARLMNHASQPIIHWPWHDYGPTTGAAAGSYTVTMFSNLIKTAYNDKAEFITGADAMQRIKTFKDAKIDVNRAGNTVNVDVTAQNVGKFAVDIDAKGKVIATMDNWYAYGKDKIYLDKDGGNFTAHLGTSQTKVTHITELPMRANLVSVSGDGNNLKYTIEGEGKVYVQTKRDERNYRFSGYDSIRFLRGDIVEFTFNTYGTHTVEIQERTISKVVSSIWNLFTSRR